MFCDTHCHPHDLAPLVQGRAHVDEGELERCRGQTAIAASAWNAAQFEFHEGLKEKAAASSAAPVLLCFAVHPQLPAAALRPDFWSAGEESPAAGARFIEETLLPLLEKLAAEKRLDAIGETGFDLFNAEYKNTEKTQDEIFTRHLEIARQYDLPVVLHIRKATHKVFPHAKALKKLPAVIFHSWRGTVLEGEALLRRGINAFFSFGSGLVNNHKEAQRCCAAFPAATLLFETDAPYMPLRGKPFSLWRDLPQIYRAASALRAGLAYSGPEDLERAAAENFARAFGVTLPQGPRDHADAGPRNVPTAEPGRNGGPR